MNDKPDKPDKIRVYRQEPGKRARVVGEVIGDLASAVVVTEVTAKIGAREAGGLTVARKAMTDGVARWSEFHLLRGGETVCRYFYWIAGRGNDARGVMTAAKTKF